jgi:hypothetical protein
MTITIGTVTLDHSDYDADDDVLYLSVGEPREPADSYGPPRVTTSATTIKVRSSRSRSSTPNGCSSATARCA